MSINADNVCNLLLNKYPSIYKELLNELSNESNIVCSPISVKPKSEKQRRSGKPCSRTDYIEQQKRNEHILDGNMFWCWDDATKNKSKVGDIFIFWVDDGKHGPKGQWISGKMVFHQVNAVCDPSKRLSSWHKNVGQTTRNVLELSPPKLEMTYDQFYSYGGRPSYHGTYYPTTGFQKNGILRQIINQAFYT